MIDLLVTVQIPGARR